MEKIQRSRGLMEGIAIGNLLGIAQEGKPSWKIAEWYPEGVREIHARTGFPDDDDLAQSIAIAEAALEGPLDVDDLAVRFWNWGEANGLGMGILTHDVLARFGGHSPQRLARQQSPRGRRGSSAGTDTPDAQIEEANVPRIPNGQSAVEASKSAWDGGRAGNGALMRCFPLAVRWAEDPMRLVRESVISAVPTHWDRRCGWSCALANLAAAGALLGRALLADELLELAKQGIAQALPELKQYGYEASVPVPCSRRSIPRPGPGCKTSASTTATWDTPCSPCRRC